MKFLKVSLVLVTIVIMASFVWYGSYKSDMGKLENDLREYLTTEKGIDEHTIISITARRSKMPKYPVGVKLKDDPQEYVYTYRGEQWVQLTPDPNDHGR
ncbi:hypothetical protein PAECIP112173_01967 [Paenibacillus sp. JJ-100]|uniref:DUF3139 domain-containing protein n=1 Tax=Paenibacillus sp. JJ-100 TaxID=2974896 RepID=UPI0022FFAA19|nr:DUF3139 domain-containing protein [Paenibacillus sp. JJ-100]CAI6065603.1 hypothetical protein PAECIP112173_01967 [Paenibacillus sp. JJ-100]